MKPILLDNSKLKSYKYCHGRVRNGSVPKVFNEEYMRLEKTSKDLWKLKVDVNRLKSLSKISDNIKKIVADTKLYKSPKKVHNKKNFNPSSFLAKTMTTRSAVPRPLSTFKRCESSHKKVRPLQTQLSTYASTTHSNLTWQQPLKKTPLLNNLFINKSSKQSTVKHRKQTTKTRLNPIFKKLFSKYQSKNSW